MGDRGQQFKLKEAYCDNVIIKKHPLAIALDNSYIMAMMRPTVSVSNLNQNAVLVQCKRYIGQILPSNMDNACPKLIHSIRVLGIVALQETNAILSMVWTKCGVYQILPVRETYGIKEPKLKWEHNTVCELDILLQLFLIFEPFQVQSQYIWQLFNLHPTKSHQQMIRAAFTFTQKHFTFFLPLVNQNTHRKNTCFCGRAFRLLRIGEDKT